jgi:hypothetical protein
MVWYLAKRRDNLRPTRRRDNNIKIDFTEINCGHAQNTSGPHPASYPTGTRVSFPGVKRPKREADDSPPSSADVKEWVELYLQSPIRLHGMVLS